MWNKTGKFIIVSIMLAMLLFVSVPGIALADDEGKNAPRSAFLELVAESLGLTPEQLRDVYREARESMDPENPDREAFKAKVEELLNDQYGIPLGTLQTAIEEARAQIKEEIGDRRARLKEKFAERKAKMLQKCEAREAKMQEWLANHPEMQEKFEARQEALQEKLKHQDGKLNQWKNKKIHRFRNTDNINSDNTTAN